jgi:hypothetical protein
VLRQAEEQQQLEMVAVSASNISLLIARTHGQRLPISPTTPVAPNTHVFPLQWLLLNRFHDAELLDEEFLLWRVARAKFVGIARSRYLGGFDSIYATMVTMGWLTLAVPALFRFELVSSQVLSLDEARSYLVKIVDASRLDNSGKASLSRRIQRAESIAAMAHAIDNARE